MSFGLRRGIIEDIVSSYEYRVRIINYDYAISDPNKTLNSDLSIATVVSQPGTKVSYNIGDRVVVGFNKDELNDPVIIGSMYTENYPTTADQTRLPALENRLYIIENLLNIVDGKSLYTHIKYSNDNGQTLTSLYEYTNVEYEFTDDLVNYRHAKDIVIDPTSSIIYWSVINENNVDVTSSLRITTILKAGTLNDNIFNEVDREKFTDTIIKIPFRLQNYEALRLDFEIVDMLEFDTYHFVLTTDKNTIGSVYGDYLGVCITNDPTAPDTPGAYSWTSFKTTIENFLGILEDSLSERVKRNEEALYGFNYSENSSKQTNNMGLLDGIAVTKEQIDIHGLNDRDISFNINKSIFINNEDNNVTTPETVYTLPEKGSLFSEVYRSNGHLTLLVRQK